MQFAGLPSVRGYPYDDRMTLVQSFPPLYSPHCRVLILGSMPGVASLQAARYYAHPRNAFWPIMQALFGIDPQQDYNKRCQLLVGKGIALWDVLQCCHRQGSLDSAIVPASEQPNDFEWLFDQCPHIHTVFFNGGKAEAAYQKHLISTARAPRKETQRLPSTSPAYAALSLPQKLAQWQQVKNRLLL